MKHRKIVHYKGTTRVIGVTDPQPGGLEASRHGWSHGALVTARAASVIVTDDLNSLSVTVSPTLFAPGGPGPREESSAHGKPSLSGEKAIPNRPFFISIQSEGKCYVSSSDTKMLAQTSRLTCCI
jgi:hypothetical protein